MDKKCRKCKLIKPADKYKDKLARNCISCNDQPAPYCSICHRTSAETRIYNNYRCRDCMKDYQAEQYKKPERKQQQSKYCKSWYEKNPDKWREYQANNKDAINARRKANIARKKLQADKDQELKKTL